ncbi:nucleotidyltransferase family protein [Arcobacter aquimarinus]|uniref:nucleotidyltransferase family protein n=1 Tax=Arcobacter aquimarinus TaxID=1315211 RepID=UPI003BAF16EF
MTQDIIINYLTEHKEQFKKDFGIIKIGLFGSYARNEAKSDSDIDILIELKKDLTDIYEKKSLLKEIMEKAFDKKVDIAREKYLKPLLKDEVLKEVKYV